MQRVRQPNRMTVNADRAKALLEAVRRRVLKGEGSHQELKAKVFEAFSKYFTNLSAPDTEFEPLLAFGLRDPNQYTELLDSAEADMKAASADAKNLSESIVAAFNAGTAEIRQLEGVVKRVSSKSQDLQHLTETFAEDTVVAGDDFADTSRIDAGAALDVPPADIPKDQNVALLKRSNSQNILDDRVKIRILSTFKLYEGCFYALNGEVRPEGGKLHFTGVDRSSQSDAMSPGAPQDLLNRFNTWKTEGGQAPTVQTPLGEMARSAFTAEMGLALAQGSGGTFGPFTTREWDMLANNYHVDPTFAQAYNAAGSIPREAETDLGASIAERQDARKRMLDGNPDTFWEAEFVIKGPEALAQNSGPAASNNGPQPGTIEYEMTYGPNAQQGSPLPPTVPQAGSMTLGELIDQISGPAFDKYDFDLDILLELPETRVVNWLNLIPHNFSDSSWLEVLDIATSLDGSVWESVEGLKEGKFENILTAEANSQLTSGEMSATLAPSRFHYVGTGVWTFPAREARFIRFRLMQKTPIPAPYDVLVVELTQTVVATHTSTSGLSGINQRTRVRSSTKEEQRTVVLSYVDTLKIMDQNRSLNGLETGQTTQTGTSEPPGLGGSALDAAAFVMDPAFALHGTTRQTTIETSGWKVKDQYYQTRWDRIRYAVAIKEIGAYSYIYSERSGFVSVPFRTPKPIASVSLRTDEIVPKVFNLAIVKPWILYWVSFNDGQSWVQISPSGEGVSNLLDGSRIPQTIHVNSGIPLAERDPRAGYADFDGPVSQIRLKAVLMRPTDHEDMSPVLKRYRLRMVLRGAL